MIAPEKIKLIRDELRRLEEREDITILWACESGSRAWGFPSTDSDYDVRFIYLRHPRDYLRASALRDVIEMPISDELDISGWDLTKALGLLRKSNPPLTEWLQSPIIYARFPGFHEGMWALCRTYFCPRSSMYHYLRMADRHVRGYMSQDTIKLKRYFYLLRPVLACQWLVEKEGVVPMEFGVLVDEMVPEGPVKDLIAELLKRKREGIELGEQAVIPELSRFITERMEGFQEVVKETEFLAPWDQLDEFFRHTLASVHGIDRNFFHDRGQSGLSEPG